VPDPADARVQPIVKEEEVQNQTLWIIVVLLVVGMLLLCCCVAAGAAGLAAYLTAAPTVSEGGIGRVEERIEQAFAVGEASAIQVDSFAGNVRVEAGGEGEVWVTVTKRAGNRSQMDQISLDIVGTEDGVRIDAAPPGHTAGFRAVDIELVVPSDVSLWLETGGGNVVVQGVVGEIEAHAGAGNIDVADAAGPVNLDTGAGEVDYAGEPVGECIFFTGAGNVTLRLPQGLDADVQLHTGVGDIRLGAFDVDGETSATEVDGVIGTGQGASIEAHSGAGSIELVQQ